LCRTSEHGQTVDALALECRRRASQATKGPGELPASDDPGIPEWGNPPVVIHGDHSVGGGGHRGN